MKRSTLYLESFFLLLFSFSLLCFCGGKSFNFLMAREEPAGPSFNIKELVRVIDDEEYPFTPEVWDNKFSFNDYPNSIPNENDIYIDDVLREFELEHGVD